MTAAARRAARVAVDLLIAALVATLAAVIWIGGFQFELGPLTLRSHSLVRVLLLLTLLVLLRIWIAAGWKKCLLAATAALAGLGIAELALALADPPLSRGSLPQIHRVSEDFGWELVPGARGVGKNGELIRINSAGFRDREWSLAAPDGVSRIAVLGDSFTFGMSVEEEESYPRQLESLLRLDGHAVEVLNFGVISWHTWQYATALEQKVLAYEPDLVVFGFYFDDLLLSAHPRRLDGGWRAHNPFAEKDDRRLTASRVLNLAHNIDRLQQVKHRHRRGDRYLQGFEERKLVIAPETLHYRLQSGELEDGAYERFARVLRRMTRRLRRSRIDSVALLIPDASQLGEPARQEVNRRIAAAAAAARVPFIDLTPAFERAPDPRELYLFPIDAHTSPEGHRIIARELAATISASRALLSRRRHRLRSSTVDESKPGAAPSRELSETPARPPGA